ncbi:MAG: alpha/beta hydrolase [Acidobacteria bacterium]|nr:alpha/beta hydrolase [Acidobacteriota bacterium]
MNKQRLHPDVVAVLEAKTASGAPAMETLPVDEARKLAFEGHQAVQAQPQLVARVDNLRIPGPDCDIPIRVYTPDCRTPLAAVVYYHGGGWVVCDLDTHEVLCRALANRAHAVVIAVDYRLAPENRFPAAVIDAYAALCWTAEHADRLHIDPRRMVVAGDSAGGNLSAVVSMMARDNNGPQIALQVLVYPVTNLAALDTPSYREFATDYNLTAAQMEWFRRNYLRRPEDALDPRASPLLAPDLKGLPPALVITAECDPLRDEGEAYAKRLEQAGVPVTMTRYAGMIHPFFTMTGAIGDSRKAIRQVGEAIRALP